MDNKLKVNIKKFISKILVLGLLAGVCGHCPYIKVRAADKAGVPVTEQEKPLNILQIGDSNTAYGYFTLNMRDILKKNGHDTGTGFFTLHPTEYFVKKKLEDVQFKLGGNWKNYDMATGGKHCLVKDSPFGVYVEGRGQGSTCTIQFVGSAINLYYNSKVGAGVYDAEIDGKSVRSVETDKYGDNKIHTELFNNLENKNHTITLTIKDNRPVRFDGVDVIGKSRENRAAVHSWGNRSSTTKDYANVDKEVFESALKEVNPNEVVVLLGTNDVSVSHPGNDPANVEKNLVTILNRIKEALPDAEIWLLSTLETRDNKDMLHRYWNTAFPNAAKTAGVNYWSMGEFYGDFNIDKMLDDLHVTDYGGKRCMNQLHSKMILKRKIDQAKDVEDRLKGYGQKVTQDLTKGITEAEKVHFNHVAAKEAVDAQIKTLEEEIKTANQAAQDIRDHKEVPRANILDVDFQDGTAYDTTLFDHRLHIMGSPIIIQDKELGRKTAEFDGAKDAFSYQMNNVDYEMLKNGYTLECMVKLKNQKQYGALFSNMGNGAIGLSAENNSIGFSEKRGGWKKLSHAVHQNQWTHLVASSDGKKMNLYINGKLTESAECSGELEFPAQAEKFFVIGGDRTNGEDIENPSKVTVDSARIFSRALTAKEVQKLYWQDERTEISVPSEKHYRAVEGDMFKVPEPIVKTASGEPADVNIKAEDPRGRTIKLIQGGFRTAPGVYKIIYEANGISAETNLKVLSKEENTPAAEKVKSLFKGENFLLDVQKRQKDSKIVYTSDNPRIASVDSYGTVHANGAGQAEIRISVEQTGHKYNLFVKINVLAEPSVETAKKFLLSGRGFAIKVNYREAGSKISFQTSEKEVVNVSKAGYVKALRAGKAVVTTTINKNGKLFVFRTNVTVKGYLKFLKAKKILKRKKSYTFRVKGYGTGSKIKWSVSNKKLAKISKKGRFTAKKKKGKVYVIVKSGKYSKKYLVTIR